MRYMISKHILVVYLISNPFYIIYIYIIYIYMISDNIFKWAWAHFFAHS